MLLVTGASGKLGAYVVAHLVATGRPVAAWSHSQAGSVAGVELQQVDLSDLRSIEQRFQELQPTGVIHCAALSAVGDCYRNPDAADLINHRATELLGRLSPRIVYTSTDLVFDGEGAPYSEDSVPNPLSVYGRSKLAGENAILAAGGLVVRVSLMYGPPGPGWLGGFFGQQLEALQEGREMKLFTDEFRTPLALDEAAQGLVSAYDTDCLGVAHMGGADRVSRYEMGVALARAVGANEELIVPLSQKDLDFGESRPADVSLTCERAKREWGWSPSTYQVGLSRLIGTLGHPRPKDRDITSPKSKG